MHILLYMLEFMNYVSVQHAPPSGYKCKYVKTYDLNRQKHSMSSFVQVRYCISLIECF